MPVFLPVGIDNMHGSRQAVGVIVMSNCAGCFFKPRERTCKPEGGYCLPQSWLSNSAWHAMWQGERCIPILPN